MRICPRSGLWVVDRHLRVLQPIRWPSGQTQHVARRRRLTHVLARDLGVKIRDTRLPPPSRVFRDGRFWFGFCTFEEKQLLRAVGGEVVEAGEIAIQAPERNSSERVSARRELLPTNCGPINHSGIGHCGTIRSVCWMLKTGESTVLAMTIPPSLRICVARPRLSRRKYGVAWESVVVSCADRTGHDPGGGRPDATLSGHGSLVPGRHFPDEQASGPRPRRHTDVRVPSRSQFEAPERCVM